MKYSFIKQFEDNWQRIYKEYLQVNKLLTEWPEQHLYGKGWEVFGLFDFPNGNEIIENTQLCPVTASLIKNIHCHGAAGFSKLSAGTVLKPHCGYRGDFLRMHLGLEIPVGDCGLRSEDQIYRWSQGKTFVFDDRLMHDAWNKTNYDRVILIVDFIP
jgi:beta-hydroxylase